MNLNSKMIYILNKMKDFQGMNNSRNNNIIAIQTLIDQQVIAI
jgi:hypothetical protein